MCKQKKKHTGKEHKHKNNKKIWPHSRNPEHSSRNTIPRNVWSRKHHTAYVIWSHLEAKGISGAVRTALLQNCIETKPTLVGKGEGPPWPLAQQPSLVLLSKWSLEAKLGGRVQQQQQLQDSSKFKWDAKIKKHVGTCYAPKDGPYDCDHLNVLGIFVSV